MDQITKVLLSSRDFFLGPMHFHLLKNYGLSFGVNLGLLLNTIIIAAAFIFFSSYASRYWKNRQFDWSLLLVIAGAASNLIDRLWLGYVRDFWDIGLGFTFNLADMFIVLGLLILFLQSNQEPAV